MLPPKPVHFEPRDVSTIEMLRAYLSHALECEVQAVVDTHPLWCIGIFFGGYFGALLDAGLGEAYCQAMGRNVEELEWFAVRGLVRDIFTDSGRQWAVHMHWKFLLKQLIKLTKR